MRKKVLIAGGGPAGMAAAVTASMRGHQVILCEKSSRLGGLLPLLETEPFKVRIGKYREYMIRQIEKRSIEVRMNTEVTPELVDYIKPDYLIAAVGAHPTMPPVKGIEKAVQVLDLYSNNTAVGDTIAMLGGGFAGVECAIGLAMQGKKVTIIEMSGALALGPNTPAPGTGAMQIDALWLNIHKYGIEVKLNTKCTEITDDGMHCLDSDGKEEFIPADNVVYAAGMSPNEEVVEALRGSCIDFAWVGDCSSAGLIKTAVHQGFNAAMAI